MLINKRVVQVQEAIVPNSYQHAALSQLEDWLATSDIQLQYRSLSTSVSEKHLTAIAPYRDPLSGKTLANTWIIASLPAISDKIIITCVQEDPRPFLDFIAHLDALSETADQICPGYRAPITHSVLQNRGQHSFILAGFQSLTPALALSKKHTQQAPALQDENSNEFQGLLVIYTTKAYSRLDNDSRFELEALTRSAVAITDLALPQRLDRISEAEEEQEKNEDEVQAIHLRHRDNSESLAQFEELSQDRERITAEDQKLLNAKRQLNKPRTYVLFLIFLIVSFLAYFYE